MKCLIISVLLDFSFVLNDPLGALPHPVHSSKYQYFIYPYPFLGGDDLDTDFFLCVSVCFWQMSVSIILDSKVRIRFELCKCLIITISTTCPKTNCSDLLRCPQIYFC